MTVLVQELWHGTVCVKGLARYYADEISMLIADPVAYLTANFGGGKFKLNFHHGWNFIATIHFKTQGGSKWEDMPGIEF